MVVFSSLRNLILNQALTQLGKLSISVREPGEPLTTGVGEMGSMVSLLLNLFIYRTALWPKYRLTFMNNII